MERQGINLTAYRLNFWKAQGIKNISYLSGVILFSGMLAGFLYFYALQKINQNRPLVAENKQLRHQLNGLSQQIDLLKHDRQTKNVPTIASSAIAEFTQLITRLPLNQGGVEFIRIYNDQKPSLKIAGILKRQSDFKRLEDYLHTFENMVVSIEHFQINDKNKVEFGLSVQWEKK